MDKFDTRDGRSNDKLLIVDIVAHSNKPARFPAGPHKRPVSLSPSQLLEKSRERERALL